MILGVCGFVMSGKRRSEGNYSQGLLRCRDRRQICWYDSMNLVKMLYISLQIELILGFFCCLIDSLITVYVAGRVVIGLFGKAVPKTAGKIIWF